MHVYVCTFRAVHNLAYFGRECEICSIETVSSMLWVLCEVSVKDPGPHTEKEVDAPAQSQTQPSGLIGFSSCTDMRIQGVFGRPPDCSVR